MGIMCRPTLVQRFISAGVMCLLVAAAIHGQTTRPRRTNKQTTTQTTTRTPAEDPLLRPEPKPSPTARRSSSNDSLLDVQPVRPVANTVASASSADTKHAYLLLEQRQFAE